MPYIPPIPPGYRPNYTWAAYMLNDWGATGTGGFNDPRTGVPLTDTAALATIAEARLVPGGLAQREVASNPSTRMRQRLRSRLRTQGPKTSPRVGIATDPGGPVAPPAHFVQWIRELGYPSSVHNGRIYVSRETVRQFQKDWNAVVQGSPLPDAVFHGFRRPVSVNGITHSQEMYQATSQARSIDERANASWKSVVNQARAPHQIANPICDRPWHTGKLECDQDQYTYGDPKCTCEVKAQLKGIPYGPDTWDAKIPPRGRQHRQAGGAPAPARGPWRSPLAPTPSSASLRARAMARRGNPAMGMRGVCPPGTAYAGTFPAAMNAYTAICTDPRTGQVVSTFGTVRTFPAQHMGQSVYRG